MIGERKTTANEIRGVLNASRYLGYPEWDEVDGFMVASGVDDSRNPSCAVLTEDAARIIVAEIVGASAIAASA